VVDLLTPVILAVFRRLLTTSYVWSSTDNRSIVLLYKHSTIVKEKRDFLMISDTDWVSHMLRWKHCNEHVARVLTERQVVLRPTWIMPQQVSQSFVYILFHNGKVAPQSLLVAEWDRQGRSCHIDTVIELNRHNQSERAFKKTLATLVQAIRSFCVENKVLTLHGFTLPTWADVYHEMGFSVTDSDPDAPLLEVVTRW
jgi:hypothetical protein